MLNAVYVLLILVSSGFVVIAFVAGARIVLRSAAAARANSRAEARTVPARLVAKQGDLTGVIDDPRSLTGYHLTFELPEGERLSFFVVGREFSPLVTGDEGDLSFQGTRFHNFLKLPSELPSD